MPWHRQRPRAATAIALFVVAVTQLPSVQTYSTAEVTALKAMYTSLGGTGWTLNSDESLKGSQLTNWASFAAGTLVNPCSSATPLLGIFCSGSTIV